MAKELTGQEKESFRGIEADLDKKVEEYRRIKEKELADGKKQELEQELKDIASYLDICQKGEADDLLINIRFFEAKQDVLRSLLG